MSSDRAWRSRVTMAMHAQAHGSFRGYLTGFLLSVVLTAIPFWLVMNNVLDNKQATAL
jgi:cytochrome o ubiquinol oxidase operon protein cyoD